jgi:hypothetical protein
MRAYSKVKNLSPLGFVAVVRDRIMPDMTLYNICAQTQLAAASHSELIVTRDLDLHAGDAFNRQLC